MLVADIAAPQLDRSCCHMWHDDRHGMVGLWPLPSTDQFQFIAMIQDREDLPLDLATLQSILNCRAQEGAPRLENPGWISRYRPNVRIAERFRHQRVFLVGDAAHIHPPSGGQGLNTSVQDAYNLGWKLDHALGGDTALLDTYEEERLRIAATLLGRTDFLYRKEVEGKEKTIQRTDKELQLQINYRGSSICGKPSFTTSLQPGDRMPNAWLFTKTGPRADLFDVMRGPRSLVLAVDAKLNTHPDRHSVSHYSRTITVSTQNNHIGSEFIAAGDVLNSLKGHILTIRPDGYIQAIDPTEAKASS